jgi:hypothetical protein
MTDIERNALKTLETHMKSNKFFLFNDTVEYKITNVYTKGDIIYTDVEDRIGRRFVLDREIDRLPSFVSKFVSIDDVELIPVEYDNRGWYRKLNDEEGVVWSRGKPFACFVFSSGFCKKESIDDSWYVQIMREKATENIFIFRGSSIHRRKVLKKSKDRYGFPTSTMEDLFKYDVYQIEVKQLYGKKCYKLIPLKDR